MQAIAREIYRDRQLQTVRVHMNPHIRLLSRDIRSSSVAFAQTVTNRVFDSKSAEMAIVDRRVLSCEFTGERPIGIYMSRSP